ncbi:hypothetical protein FB192DRAFT_1446506 [Mucor lusitanicus]|uniref:Uncharacterized protein n=1 Tax=Mucor circinelloides f. lusitanicus TaxID=29924 RepID=A0A8H4BG74_MUCCL|nr:hypothetical protein FB192DRAFT_1446506 [Mucor lusitanicus]
MAPKPFMGEFLRGQEEKWIVKKALLPSEQKLVVHVVKVFEELHPNCRGVFLFDSSSNHQAYRADALLARNMTLKDKNIKHKLNESNEVIHKEGDRWYPFRNGKFPNGQEQIICTYTTLSEEARKEYHLHIKGVSTILKERSLWFAKNPCSGAKINTRCEAKKDGEVVQYLDGSTNDHCCHFHILHRQPDFKLQRPLFEDSVFPSDHIVDLYPKFHCETNWIERHCGAAKWKARKECDYAFDSLKQKLDSFLDDVGAVKVNLDMANPRIIVLLFTKLRHKTEIEHS